MDTVSYIDYQSSKWEPLYGSQQPISLSKSNRSSYHPLDQSWIHIQGAVMQTVSEVHARWEEAALLITLIFISYVIMSQRYLQPMRAHLPSITQLRWGVQDVHTIHRLEGLPVQTHQWIQEILLRFGWFEGYSEGHPNTGCSDCMDEDHKHVEVPYGCWFNHALGSGIYVDVGRTLP